MGSMTMPVSDLSLQSSFQLRSAFRTDDANLRPIAAKVQAGERLSFEDGVALYRSGDILAVGWLANLVRERMHGNTAYFNVNRHINPTNVCVASCRLCAFGRKKGEAGILHDGAGRGVGRRLGGDTPRPSPSFTSSEDCTLTCHSNTSWTWSVA